MKTVNEQQDAEKWRGIRKNEDQMKKNANKEKKQRKVSKAYQTN